MRETHRSERELADGCQDDWPLLARIERILADHADEWDDGQYRVVLTDDIGEHRGQTVDEARSAFEREGRGNVRRTVLTAWGGGRMPRCEVDLCAARSGRVVAEHPDETVAEDLAGAVERLVVGREPDREPDMSASDSSGLGGASSHEASPSRDMLVAALLAAVVVVVVAWAVTGAQFGAVLRNPWVVTIAGGLLATFVAWLVRRTLDGGK